MWLKIMLPKVCSAECVWGKMGVDKKVWAVLVKPRQAGFLPAGLVRAFTMLI